MVPTPSQPTDPQLHQLQQLQDALLDAFSTYDALRAFTRTRLNVDLEAIVPVQNRNLTQFAQTRTRGDIGARQMRIQISSNRQPNG